MTVFISYRHTDRLLAQQIDARLKQQRISTYLDVLDDESGTTEDITSVITQRVADCSHLLAIISRETALSWWVPFEIGEATIIDRRIAAFRVGSAGLPDYLKKWPVLATGADLDFFIEEYKRDRSRLEESISLESILGSVTGKRAFANDFHEKLKARVGRGF